LWRTAIVQELDTIEMSGTILARIRKNAHEALLLREVTRQGRHLLELRVFVDDGGALQPTIKGLSLRPEIWWKVLQALLPVILRHAEEYRQDYEE
jgi:hypothetical protein